jgi:NAD(P)-dependent dehydrogenase (short-subunit alcohol dehydrogenase family)
MAEERLMPPEHRTQGDGLSGQVAIVSGAAGGIGVAIARELVSRGAGVVLADLGQAGEKAADGINGEGLSGRAWGQTLDVTDAAQWTRVVNRTRRRFGHPTILVNAAGVLDTSGLAGTDEAGWARVLEVGQRGTWLGMSAVLRSMTHVGHGAIINVTSVLGRTGSGVAFAYQAAKAAVRAMTRAAAVELAGHGIRVNSVCPGIIDTPMSGEAPAGFIQKAVRATPLGRHGTAGEVADAVAFLASARASFVNGAELVVDGGFSARSAAG